MQLCSSLNALRLNVFPLAPCSCVHRAMNPERVHGSEVAVGVGDPTSQKVWNLPARPQTHRAAPMMQRNCHYLATQKTLIYHPRRNYIGVSRYSDAGSVHCQVFRQTCMHAHTLAHRHRHPHTHTHPHTNTHMLTGEYHRMYVRTYMQQKKRTSITLQGPRA